MERKKTGTAAAQQQDVIALLTEDHKKVQRMFKDFEGMKEQASEDEKAALVKTVCNELLLHSQLEEEIFYPAVREAIDDDALMDEAEVEHAGAKDLIEQLEFMDAGDALFDAKFTVLGEQIAHHIEEEQNEMFVKAKKAKLDTVALGQEVLERKQELMQEMGMDATSPSGSSASSGRSSTAN
jgi:hypothetical protein